MKTVILKSEVSRMKSPDKIFSLHEAENFESNFSQIFVKSLSKLLNSLRRFIWLDDWDQFVMKEINMRLKIVLLLWSKSIVNCKMLITNSCIPLGITIVYSILNIVSSSQFTCRSWSSSTSSQETNASYIHVYCV